MPAVLTACVASEGGLAAQLLQLEAVQGSNNKHAAGVKVAQAYGHKLVNNQR
jgi:hypothetical protein